MASDLGVKPETVLEMESRLSGQDVGYDGYPDSDSVSVPTAPATYLTDVRMEPSVQVEEEEWDEHNSDQLREAIAALDERSRDILEQRWLGDKKTTLQTLARKYDVSAERIRQLEKEAMKKLRIELQG